MGVIEKPCQLTGRNSLGISTGIYTLMKMR